MPFSGSLIIRASRQTNVFGKSSKAEQEPLPKGRHQRSTAITIGFLKAVLLRGSLTTCDALTRGECDLRKPHHHLPDIESEVEFRYFSFENIAEFTGTVTVVIHADYDTGSDTPLATNTRLNITCRDTKEGRYEISVHVGKSGRLGTTSAKKRGAQRDTYLAEGRFQLEAQAIYDYYRSPEGEAAWKRETIAHHEVKIDELQAEINYRRSKIAQYT